MKVVRIEANFPAWRDRARLLLNEATRPEDLLWEDDQSESQNLFQSLTQEDENSRASSARSALTIPKSFFSLGELVACHSNPERWASLYRVAWRMTHGGEKELLTLTTDSEVKRLQDWASEIRRARHKMKAFVRFRKVGESQSEPVREQFVAWFEPDHDIIELTAPFFAKRFAGMDWSILTPFRCAHWNGEKLRYSDGVDRKSAPENDALEDYWRSYYAHIFNPARLKLKAMQSEMPKKYWKHLPEAPLIADLTSKASIREVAMITAPSSERAHVSSRVPKGTPKPDEASDYHSPIDYLKKAESLSVSEIRQAAKRCRACPLHERATQCVFGEGPETASIMIVGEQPGDHEDLLGKPFQGPAGQLLDQALRELEIDRDSLYITNIVKHFKWKRQGKRRLHQKPSREEVDKCRPWTLAEIFKVRPSTLICLGSTPSKALIRHDFAVMTERGLIKDCPLANRVIATVHPSYLLRLPPNEKERALEAWKNDLALAI